jgi:hypothetical protein
MTPQKLTRWFFFTVIAALIPVIHGCLNLWTYDKPLSLNSVSSKGELLLISAGIGGAAIGELVAPRTSKKKTMKLICAGLCFAS